MSVLTHDDLVPDSTQAPPDGDRMARARAVLARAEERTGAQTARRTGSTRSAEVGTTRSAEATTTRSAQPVTTRPTERVLPVPEHLAALLPSGGLERGSTLEVRGSTSLVLGLTAAASRAGSWTAVVGLPQVGILAAHQTGLDLARIALVPDPGRDAATVVAALVDGVDVVVVGPGVALVDADRRRLSARARERSAVLLSTAPWPGAAVVLTAEGSTWEGLGRGHGRLRGRRMTVLREGRGAAARPTRFQVLVPPPREATVPAAAAGPAVPAVPAGPAGPVGSVVLEGWRAG